LGFVLVVLSHAKWISFFGFAGFAKDSGRSVSTITHRETTSIFERRFPMADSSVIGRAGF
jgi:hypothetical protein